MKPLYKYDSKGNIRVWKVYTTGNQVIVTHGMLDGKMQIKATKCKGKNIGKSNETTPDEQAKLEAQAKWTKQVDRDDYAEDVDQSGLQLRPMLAMDYRKVPHRVDWNDAVLQPKLDGLRLSAGDRWEGYTDHELMTRKGDTYNIPHLFDATAELLEIVNQYRTCQALDGEAYIHGMPLQQIIRLAKKYRKGETEQLKYYIFDLYIPNLSFTDRYAVLDEAMKEYTGNDFVLVPTHQVKDEASMKLMHGKYLEQGYEGAMIRHASAEYGFAKRSADLFKYKEFFDCEALITDVWEDNNGNAMLTVKLKNGLSCGVTPKRTHVERKEMLNQVDDLVGKWITVKYQALTDDGNLQFPVGMEIRECDANGNPIM